MSSLEQLLYGISQLFLGPVLLAVLILFGYAFHALGAFLMQAHQRSRAWAVWKGMSCCWLTPATPA